MLCRLQGFPDLAFLEFTIAGHHDDPTAGLACIFGPCHSFGFGNSHAQRSRVGFNPGYADIRMAMGTTMTSQVDKSFF